MVAITLKTGRIELTKPPSNRIYAIEAAQFKDTVLLALNEALGVGSKAPPQFSCAIFTPSALRVNLSTGSLSIFFNVPAIQRVDIKSHEILSYNGSHRDGATIIATTGDTCSSVVFGNQRVDINNSVIVDNSIFASATIQIPQFMPTVNEAHFIIVPGSDHTTMELCGSDSRFFLLSMEIHMQGTPTHVEVSDGTTNAVFIFPDKTPK